MGRGREDRGRSPTTRSPCRTRKTCPIWSPTRPRCRAFCYDLVCNGSEAASGSIRIHKRDIQERIFKMLGKTDEQIQAQFGHMLDAFDFGAPPARRHGPRH